MILPNKIIKRIKIAWVWGGVIAMGYGVYLNFIAEGRFSLFESTASALISGITYLGLSIGVFCIFALVMETLKS